MESFAPILGLAMIIFGLILLVFSIGLLIYAFWLRYRVEPSRNRQEAVVTPDRYSGEKQT